MKLIVQIPCFNEAETLRQTLGEIPRRIPGVDEIEVLVIDDGSTDGTSERAREVGIDHVVRHKTNMGLARAFRTGIETCLELGADIIVNTDGDNQYAGADIPRLIAPILAGEADIVVGDRQTANVPHFSFGKKLLQALGSFVVRQLSHTDVPDTVSGFRAISREAALHLNIVSSFSYTIEMLIQAGRKQMAVTSVPVGTNAKTRRSRLFKSVPSFVRQSLVTMIRMYAMYRPLRVFFYIGMALSVVGSLPILRFVYLYMNGQGDGHIQSLVLGGVLVVLGFMALLIGLVADLIGFNRQLVEITLEKVRRLELAIGRTAGTPTTENKKVVEQIAQVEQLARDWPAASGIPGRPEAKDSSGSSTV